MMPTMKNRECIPVYEMNPGHVYYTLRMIIRERLEFYCSGIMKSIFYESIQTMRIDKMRKKLQEYCNSGDFEQRKSFFLKWKDKCKSKMK